MLEGDVTRQSIQIFQNPSDLHKGVHSMQAELRDFFTTTALQEKKKKKKNMTDIAAIIKTIDTQENLSQREIDQEKKKNGYTKSARVPTQRFDWLIDSHTRTPTA